MAKKNGKDIKPEIPSIEALKAEIQRVNSKRSLRRTLLRITGALTVAAAITALAVTKLFVLLQVNGSSMQPALAHGEIVVVQQASAIKRGDIIGFYYGGNILLKRVIGSEGDYIEIDREGNVYVNEEKLEEPYLSEKQLGKCEVEFPCKVPEGSFFVLGDNRAISIDSRVKTIGYVKDEQIVGKLVFRMWPLARMGICI